MNGCFRGSFGCGDLKRGTRGRHLYHDNLLPIFASSPKGLSLGILPARYQAQHGQSRHKILLQARDGQGRAKSYPALEPIKIRPYLFCNTTSLDVVLYASIRYLLATRSLRAASKNHFACLKAIRSYVPVSKHRCVRMCMIAATSH